jgi:hypothetical protein
MFPSDVVAQICVRNGKEPTRCRLAPGAKLDLLHMNNKEGELLTRILAKFVWCYLVRHG